MSLDDAARRRRIAIAAIAGVAVLFTVELIALATGNLELAAACFVAFVALWFVLRALTKRRDARDGPAGRR